MRHLSSVLYSLSVLFSLIAAACSGNANADPQSAAPLQPLALSAANLPVNSADIPLIAKVNGTEITLPAFERALSRRQQEINAADSTALAADVLDTLIEQTLIEQAAAALGVSVSEADVEAELQTNINLAGGRDKWQEWLAQNLYTEDEFRQTLREMLITGRVRDAVTQEVSGNVRHVHARHILVRTEDEAKQALQRLQAGEDFGALARELSRDVTSAEQGGDLGWFTQDQLLEPVLAQVAFSLLPGQIAGPVATRLGYHVIQTLEFEDRPVNPENQAALMQIQFENWLQSLLDSAKIERYGGF